MADRPVVLIIDDDEATRHALSSSLAAFVDVIDAPDGESAVAMVREHRPALVLLDLNLGNRTGGLEVCRIIKRVPTDQPTHVMIISGTADAASRVAGYEAGADDFLAKPFDRGELIAKTRLHLERHRVVLELANAQRATEFAAGRLATIVEDQARGIVVARTMTARALAALAENRDTDTGAHLDRMRDYAIAIATELERDSPYADQIDGGFLERLHHAAPLHDIGKVAIPDSILQKPGRLTADEFEVMKSHAAAGAQVLEAILSFESDGGISDEASFMPMAVAIARHHHERWDGAGYPGGLAGEDIPLAARITTAADVLDALASARCYKAAMSLDEARQIMNEGRGSHFDPVVLEAFDRAWPRIVQIQQSFAAVAASRAA